MQRNHANLPLKLQNIHTATKKYDAAQKAKRDEFIKVFLDEETSVLIC